MRATAWKGAMYGVRLGKENAQRYFDPTWSSVQIEIDGAFQTCRLAPSFWRKCPEICSMVIQKWLIHNRLAPWPQGRPPVLELTPLGGDRFRLTSQSE